MQTCIYLIRHGLTAANLNKVFAGRSDEPLLPEGEQQMRRACERLLSLGINRIFCGPLPRTRQSAAIAAELLAAPVSVEEALNEILIPHWDGLSKEKIGAQFGPEYPTWLNDPAGFQAPGCETIAGVQNRAVPCLEKMFHAYQGRNLLVISHLIVIRALALHYLQRTIAGFREIKIDNAQIIKLARTASGEIKVDQAYGEPRNQDKEKP